MRRLAVIAACAGLAAAAAAVPSSQAQVEEPAAAPHLAAGASAALLQTPPGDPRDVGAPAFPLPANPRQVSTMAEASTTGFDGDPATSRASASPDGGRAARPVDLAAGVCPPAAEDGTRVIADAQANAGQAGTRSTVALVPVDGRDGLAVRAQASTAIASVTIGTLELRVLEQARLVAEATGAAGGSRVHWEAPVIEVVDTATGARLARLDESHASYRAPDESEFGGRNQPFRIALAAPDERMTSPDGGFARARAALARIRFQPSLELGELTIGQMAVSATAPAGGVTTCDGGEPLPQERALPHVLIYEGNNGFEHVSRHEANRTIARLAGESGAFSFEITDQATFMRDDRLAGVDMVMFNNNVGNMPAGSAQRQAFEDYVSGGGGMGGIHSATDANYDWQAYGEMFGARFDGHPHVGYMPEWGKARVVVENQTSPITSGWHGQDSFEWADEYYRWREQDLPFGPEVDVLLSLDTTTTMPGTRPGSPRGLNPYGAYRVERQPIAWTKPYGAGRVFYTNMGHNGFAWAHPEFRTMMLEGIRWAATGP